MLPNRSLDPGQALKNSADVTEIEEMNTINHDTLVAIACRPLKEIKVVDIDVPGSAFDTYDAVSDCIFQVLRRHHRHLWKSPCQ